MQIRGFVRTIKDGEPVPDGTEVRIYSHATQALLQTVTTLGGAYEHNFQGNPGPYWVEVEYGDEVHLSSSKVIGMAGPVSIGGIPLLFRLWHDGYIPDVLDELLVSSTGVGMSVTVGAGVGIVRGVLYDQSEPLTLPIEAADSQGRIDLVALQVVPAGANPDTEGRARVIVKRGTPSGSPTPPGLTQSQSIWEIPLAHVVVDAGVSSIAESKVQDKRSRSNVKIEDGYITTGMIADGAITPVKLSESYALSNHSHAWSEITGKPSSYPPSSHSHSWGQITGKPSTFPPSSHTHSGSQITDNSIAEAKLSAAVRNKLNAPGYHAPIRSHRNSNTKASYSSTTNLIGGSISLPSGGTYAWFAIGLVRVTGENSSPLVQGWLRIMMDGSEQGAVPFHVPGGFSPYGGSVQVMATGVTTGGSRNFQLNWRRDSGTMTVNSRQLMVWVQRIS